VLFGKHPQTLDYAIYNDLENYKTEKRPQSGYVHQPDLGVLLEITPRRAKLVTTPSGRSSASIRMAA
jgi:hypothetical protein